MAELKTQETKKSPLAFIKALPDPEKRADSLKLLKIFKDATGEKPKMWGTAIVGFGKYHYQSERSSQKGDWPLTGFSPRKQNMTVYIMPGFKEYSVLMKKLGKYKTSVSCLYFKKLADLDVAALSKLVNRSYRDMKKKYRA